MNRLISRLIICLMTSTLSLHAAQNVNLGYWNELGKLPVVPAGPVSISGNIAAVPAPDGTVISIYLFAKQGGSVVNIAKLSQSDPVANDGFGYAISIKGDTIAVGAIYGNDNQGKVYVYVKPPGGWTDMTETAQLTASDGSSGNNLGVCVSTSGNVVVAGAHLNSTNGAVYVFIRPGGGWTDKTQNAKLTASDGQQGDNFAISCAVSGNTVAVGASNRHSGNGAVYVFTATNASPI